MKHDSPHPWGESPCFGRMTTEIETSQIEVRDNAYWPAEALLTAFAEEDDRVDEPDQPPEDSLEYALLYFVS